MIMPTTLAAAALLGAPLLAPCARALEVDWAIPSDRKPYASLSGTVGDAVVFAYDPGHNVVLHPTGNCDGAGGEFLGSTSPTEYAFTRAGSYTFACSVSEGVHCSLGQIITFTITDPAEVLAQYAEFFNPAEEQYMLEYRIKPYKIPSAQTTYTDFLFNLPEDIGDIVHIVVGDVINTQPKHLHHFVLSGCPERVDPALEGMSQSAPEACVIPMGLWAVGGTFFGGMTNDTGAVLGPSLGVRALSLNVHYTDGELIDSDYPNDGMQAIATDGFRILYTPNLRPRSLLLKPLIQIGVGPSQMIVPPGEPRYFYTKTCTVEPSCQDTSDKRLADMSVGFTCGEVEGNCNVADSFDAIFISLLCPVACGACSAATAEDSDPGGYHIDAVNYHAHLLGREMYTTLLPNKRSDVPVDLESKDLWLFDFQFTYPIRDTRGDDPAFRVYPGDKIQTTCVYDSTLRDTATSFFLSTYDEMCVNQLAVLVDTPATGAASGASLLARLNALSFNCAVDDDSAIWNGSLDADEDGRDIWKDHPMQDADCTFPVGTADGQLIFLGDSTPTFEARCVSGTATVGPCPFCTAGTLDTSQRISAFDITCGEAAAQAANAINGDQFCSSVLPAMGICCPKGATGGEVTDTTGGEVTDTIGGEVTDTTGDDSEDTSGGDGDATTGVADNSGAHSVTSVVAAMAVAIATLLALC